MNSFSYVFPILLAGFAAAACAVMIAQQVPGLWLTSTRFNSTDDWTPVPQGDQEPAPLATPLSDWFRRVITRQLEAGETLEGFANGFFSPPRPCDWGIKMGLDKVPVLIAVTSRRILLFEMGYRTVQRSSFIDYGAVQFLIVPKPGFLGTSGKLRFKLTSGREYQFGFLGPLFSDEGMRQEQRLAGYLRSIAPRFASTPASDSRAA